MKERVKLWVRKGFKLGIILTVLVLMINTYVVLSTNKQTLTLEEAKGMQVDCVMVLGAGVFSNGTPSMMLEDRLFRGVELYDLEAGNKVLMSGDHGRINYDEVNIMKDFAIQEGIISADIFMDHAGFSTYESMYRARDVFEVETMIIVTQGYHLSRALYNAKGLDIEVYGVAADQHRFRGQLKRDIREILARTKDFFYVLFKPEPTFLGDVIPIDGSGDLTND